MTYSFSYLEPVYCPCPVLTVASRPAYKFLKRQIRSSGIPISLRIFQFIVIHAVKDFGVVIYCCRTNYPNIEKTEQYSYLLVYVSQGSGHGLAWCLWLKMSYNVAVQHLAGTEVLFSSGELGQQRSTFKLISMVAGRLLFFSTWVGFLNALVI